MSTLRQRNKSLYWAWKALKQRCKNPNCKAYKNYGARGISVCKEWEEFEPFLEWALQNGYEKGLDLDRINNDGDYCPENCRWISRQENINNRRVTTYLTINGETKPRTEWEELAGVPYGVTKEWIRTRGIQYAEQRIADALEHGYTPKDFSYGHKKAVVHIESGMTFSAVKEAAKYFGISKGHLSNIMRLNKGKSKHGTFAFVEQHKRG